MGGGEEGRGKEMKKEEGFGDFCFCLGFLGLVWCFGRERVTYLFGRTCLVLVFFSGVSEEF